MTALPEELMREARVKPRPLEWVAEHGVAGLGPYRLFHAESPLGRFSYGTDSEGQCYWHMLSGGVFLVGDEAAAKKQAEAHWAYLAVAQASKFIILTYDEATHDR